MSNTRSVLIYLKYADESIRKSQSVSELLEEAKDPE